MKILYVITGLGLGGAETVTVDIANRMARRGHKVMILYLAGVNQYRNIIDVSIEVAGLGMKKNPIGVISAMRKARKSIIRFRPDIVHGNMVHANIFSRILRLFCKIPFLISTEHSNHIGGRLRMAAYRLTDRLSDINTNVSQAATRYFIERKAFREGKSFTVYNGIDLEKFSPDKDAGNRIRVEYGIGRDEFLWINAGRLAEAKNQDNLLRAFAKEGFGRLMIVGEGHLRKRLETLAADLNLAGKVIFTGVRSDIADCYNAADCFVLSSVWEGFGLATAEAMAVGLPVIVTDAGGCKEVVDDMRWVVPARDSAALAAKMDEMRGLPAGDRNVIGIANREKARRFDIERTAAQWEEIYINKREFYRLKSPLHGG